jgi:membrane protease YdiL (CAAX protease family)
MISEITDRRRIFEIIAVILTGFSKVLFINILELHAVYIISAIIFWGTYFVCRVSRNRSLIYYWGLSVTNIKQTFTIVSIAGVIAIGTFIVLGFYNNTLLLIWNLVFVLLTYPLWGLVQQFIVMSILANNLSDYRGGRLNYYLVILITSLMFSVVHFPSIPLIIATFLMAVFYSVIFLKYRNIIPLGIFHGIMGGLFFYLVLGKDTWSLFIRIFS